MAKRGRPVSGNIAVPSSDSESLRIRPISNGFIVARSGSRGGKYFDTEEYCAEKPDITVGASPAASKAPRRGRSKNL